MPAQIRLTPVRLEVQERLTPIVPKEHERQKLSKRLTQNVYTEIVAAYQPHDSDAVRSVWFEDSGTVIVGLADRIDTWRITYDELTDQLVWLRSITLRRQSAEPNEFT